MEVSGIEKSLLIKAKKLRLMLEYKKLKKRMLEKVKCIVGRIDELFYKKMSVGKGRFPPRFTNMDMNWILFFDIKQANVRHKTKPRSYDKSICTLIVFKKKSEKKTRQLGLKYITKDLIV